MSFFHIKKKNKFIPCVLYKSGLYLFNKQKYYCHRRHFCRGGLNTTYPTANGCLDHGEELVNNTDPRHEICITVSLSAHEWHSKSTISFYPTQVKNMNSQAKRNLKRFHLIWKKKYRIFLRIHLYKEFLHDFSQNLKQLQRSTTSSTTHYFTCITSSIPSGKKPSGLITTLLYFFLIRTHLVPQLCQQNSTRSETTLSNYDWIDS